jgi:hypothetical protein
VITFGFGRNIIRTLRASYTGILLVLRRLQNLARSERRCSIHILVKIGVDLRALREPRSPSKIKHGDLMRRLLATMSNGATGLAPALLALALVPLPSDVALSDPSGAEPSAPAMPSAPACSSNDVVVFQADPSPGSEPPCEAAPRTPGEIAEARVYVIETASPGYTMTLQGAELAIGRLHPEFVVRLANATREARNAGLPFAGVFSAYRPPAFGVGGFSDKFNSLHTYGLAVDMHGIGRPGSPEAQLWHEIAARNGVVCPYGPRDRAEWNHCQPTRVKIILAENPLRETVSAAGPYDLESMFEAGNSMIASMASAADSLSTTIPIPIGKVEAAGMGLKPTSRVVANRRAKRYLRVAMGRAATKLMRDAKLGARVRAGGAPIVTVGEARRKAKSGARTISSPRGQGGRHVSG